MSDEVMDDQSDQQEIIRVPVDSLLLDALNPRLPEEKLGLPQPELLAWLNDEEVLNELGSSMLVNGFFDHEPLVVLPADADGKHIVVEGNRRFATLSILHRLPSAIDAGVNFDFATPPTADQLARLARVPALIVPDRDEVRKFLGYRHIGGLRTWSPESKARYLEEEIDRAVANGSRDPFKDVARRVGSTGPAVRGQYVALKVLRAARDVYGLDSSFIIKRRFGVWNRLMNSPQVRVHIGYREGMTYEEVLRAVESLDRDGLARVIADLTPEQSGGKAVLADSRDVTIYGAALANPRALEAIVTYRDLKLAEQIVEGTGIVEKLRSLTRSIDLFVQDLDSYELDEEAESVARGLFNSARTLNAAVRERVSGDD